MRFRRIDACTRCGVIERRLFLLHLSEGLHDVVAKATLRTRAAVIWLSRFELDAAAEARFDQRLVRDGGRPLPSAKGSDVNFLGNAQRVIEFDAEVSHRAVHFGVTKQELNGSEISRLPVDQRRFRPS